MPGWHHDNANWAPKECPVCHNVFTPKSGAHRFCGEKCKGVWKYTSGRVTTESQYRGISGDWKRYCNRLLYHGGRKRDKLTVDVLLSKLEEQDYKCALSGAPLTCQLVLGVVSPTNASVDRIVAGGPYEAWNIQMVCRALNSWRSNLTTQDFVNWCRLVVAHADRDKLPIAAGVIGGGEQENDHGEIA